MTIRPLLATLAVLAAAAPTALAKPGASGLPGQGENIEGIARVEIPGANEVELSRNWAFVSTDAVGSGADKTTGGLTIVNIARPSRPFIQATWFSGKATPEDANASFGDVDLSADGNLAVLTNAHASSRGAGANKLAWAYLIDVSDKDNPRLVGKVKDDSTMDYVHTATLDNGSKTLYLNPQVAAFFPQTPNAHITAFDISDPANPRKLGVIKPPGSDAGLAHDSFIDHRPDGKTLMYAASVHKTDVIEITSVNPLASNWLQSSTSPSYTISHDAQPNHDRSLIVVDDEGAAGGQLDESVSACGKAGQGPASVDSGSVHFFAANDDGTFANGGAVHLGSFNAPTNVNTGACVAHVFWQAPDENRMTQAYYRTGAFIVDFEDPANPKMLGWFLPDGGAMYWSNKPHNGYMYASNMEGSLDVLKYTGEGGKRWPATAGPADVQRAERQGVAYKKTGRSG